MARTTKFYRIGEPLKLEEVDIPHINDNEVLLKVRAASMCYSDIHVITGAIPVRGPVTLGHEIAGDIVEIGASVKNVKKGDRAIVHFVTPCSDCYFCLSGKSNICMNINSTPMYGFSVDGGYADYIKADSARIINLAPTIPYDFGASLGCAGITAIHAVNSIGRVTLGDIVAVYGTGGVGMYVLQLAKLSGADITIAIGRTEEKLQLAQQKFGADGTINITKERLHEGIKRISTGKGVDVMFDFVVNRESVENSIRVLKNSGKLILVGVVNDQVIITPKRITLKEVSVVGSSVGSKNELQLLVDLAEKRKLLGVTSVRHRLDQVNEALRALKEGKIIGRGYIDPLMQ